MAEGVPCPLCDGLRAVPEPRKTRFLAMSSRSQVVSCADCGLVYLSPRMSLDEMQRGYDEHPYYVADSAERGAPRMAFCTRRVERIERHARSRGSMLGVACLDGGYQLRAAADRGWQVRVVEFAPHQLRHAREVLGLDAQLAHGWDLADLDGERFDVVLSLSLEHMPRPLATLARCRELLKPQGIALFEVPNQFHSLKDIVKAALLAVTGGRAMRHLLGEAASEFHLTYFTPRTFRRALEKAGFEILELRTYLPGHPLFLRNPHLRSVQEAIYRIGGWIARGPSIEVIARRRAEPVAAGSGAHGMAEVGHSASTLSP